jgi:hypothetical protein
MNADGRGGSYAEGAIRAGKHRIDADNFPAHNRLNFMTKGNSQKTANGSALDFEAQLWASAAQEVPAPSSKTFLGEFCTTQCVMQVLVAMLEPYKGRVFEILQSANTVCRRQFIPMGWTAFVYANVI